MSDISESRPSTPTPVPELSRMQQELSMYTEALARIKREIAEADAVKAAKELEVKKVELELKTAKTTLTFEKMEKDLRLEFQKGNVHCTDLRHYEKKAVEGQQWKVWKNRPARHIVGFMLPYAKAKCPCEVDALRYLGNQHQKIWTLQTDWIAPGAQCRGIGDFNEKFGAKRVVPVKYQLSPAAFKQLHERFPSVMFVSSNAGHHDHPVAHTSAIVTGHLVLDSLPPGNYLDLYGNPGSNDAFNKRQGPEPDVTILTAVAKAAPKDFLREATKWGSAPRIEAFDRDLGDSPAFPAEQMARIDGLLSFHTLYYMSPAEIHRLLSRCRAKATLRATVHKFGGPDDKSGTINCGEQSWARIRGEIIQTNMQTKEEYRHADNAWMFQDYTWKGEDNRGLVWTANKLCDDTYLLTFSCYDPRACGQLSGAGAPPKQDAAAAKEANLQVNSTAYVRRNNHVKIGKYKIPIPDDAIDIFNENRTRMSHQARTAEKFRDHVSFVRSSCRKSVLHNGGKNMDPEVVSDICIASFWVDLAADLERMVSQFDDNVLTSWQSQLALQHGAGASGKHGATFLLDLITAANAKDRRSAVSGAITVVKSYLRK